MDDFANLTFDQLPSAVGELLSKIDKVENHLVEIRNRLDDTSREDTHVIMDIKEAAAFLKKEVSTLYAYTSERRIPFFKRGNTLYFFKDQLLKWIEDGGTYDRPYDPSPAEKADFEAHLALLQKGKKHKPSALRNVGESSAQNHSEKAFSTPAVSPDRVKD